MIIFAVLQLLSDFYLPLISIIYNGTVQKPASKVLYEADISFM